MTAFCRTACWVCKCMMHSLLSPRWQSGPGAPYVCLLLTKRCVALIARPGLDMEDLLVQQTGASGRPHAQQAAGFVQRLSCAWPPSQLSQGASRVSGLLQTICSPRHDERSATNHLYLGMMGCSATWQWRWSANFRDSTPIQSCGSCTVIACPAAPQQLADTARLCVPDTRIWAIALLYKARNRLNCCVLLWTHSCPVLPPCWCDRELVSHLCAAADKLDSKPAEAQLAARMVARCLSLANAAIEQVEVSNRKRHG